MKKIQKILFFFLVFSLLFPGNIVFAQGTYVLPERPIAATLTFTRNSPGGDMWTGTYTPAGTNLNPGTPRNVRNLTNNSLQAGNSGILLTNPPEGAHNITDGGNTVTVTGQNNIDRFADATAQGTYPSSSATDVARRQEMSNQLRGNVAPGTGAENPATAALNSVGANLIDATSTSLTNNPLSNSINNTKKDEPKIYDKIGNFLLYILNYTIWLTTILLGFLLDLSSKLIDFAFKATNIAGSDTVQKGWTFTRDMLNFIFILVLLAISFSTIAGLETLSMRKTLPRLLFSALLVNFSLAICGAFLQISNVMTTTIADSVMPSTKYEDCNDQGEDKGVGCRLALGLLNAGQIGQLYTYKNVEWLEKLGLPLKMLSTSEDGVAWENIYTKTFGQFVTIVVKSAMSMVMIGVFTIAFITLGALMLVRLVALIILVILSPVPYVFSVVPRAQAYADKWWSTFINYTFFLPVATFFLALAIRLLQRTSNKGNSSLAAEFWGGGGANDSFLAGVTGSLVDVVFITVFIFGALYAARALSIFGTAGALSAAKGTVLGAGKLGMMPARLVGQGALAGGKFVGKKTAAGIGNQLASTKLGSMALTGSRQLGRFGQRIGSGQEASAQVSEQQKAVKHMTDDQLKDAMTRGNAGAAAELMDRGELKSDEDFAKAKKLIPKNTQMGEKLAGAHQSRSPVSANSGKITNKQIKEKLATSNRLDNSTLTDIANAKDKNGGAVTDNIRSGLKRMKDEDISKNQDEVRAALQVALHQMSSAGGGVSDASKLAVALTPQKLNAYAQNLDTSGQTDLKNLIVAMRSKGMLSAAADKAATKNAI